MVATVRLVALQWQRVIVPVGGGREDVDRYRNKLCYLT
jgi:hypothetical protein